MFVKGLSDLIVTIMAAGEVYALPARDHRRLHEALAALEDGSDPVLDRLWLRFGGRRVWTSDPGVRRRAGGVTTALWEAVNGGIMRAVEHTDGTGEYIVNTGAATAARRQLMTLPPAEAALLYRVGAAWASASTARKKRASASGSSASTRVRSLA